MLPEIDADGGIGVLAVALLIVAVTTLEALDPLVGDEPVS